MRTLSAELLGLIVVFQPLFTKPSWENAKVLLLGVLLARGKRTVTACLRVVGMGDEEHFQNYHRVLNRAKWSALEAARILLGLIILIFAAGLQKIIVLAGDDTIERRRGKKIKQLGCYRRPGQIESKADHQMLWLEVGFAGGDDQIAVGRSPLGVAIFYRPVLGSTRRATAEGLSLSHSPSRPQEQDAEIARQDNRQEEVRGHRQNTAAAQDGCRYSDDHDSVDSSLDAGTGEGLGG